MNKTLAWIASSATLLFATNVCAQAFGDAATAAPEVPMEQPAPVGTGSGIDATLEAQEATPPEAGPDLPAIEQIQLLLADKPKWVRGYDEERNRIIITDSIKYEIKNPEISSDYLALRTEKTSELLLMAKAKIIETIMSKMSGSRILDIPGNPIAKQMEKELKEIKKQMAYSLKQIAQLDADMKDAVKAKESMSAKEIMATISSWFLKKDQENYAAKLDADSKERYENLKKDMATAQQTFQQIAEKADELKGTISKELKTSISKVSAMPIFGCTVMAQAESIEEKNGKFFYEQAIVYSWSMDMQKAASEILQGRSVNFKPGKRSIGQWIAKNKANGALGTWIGPRKFIDNKGQMWFLGIAYAATDDEDPDQEVANREMAELEASAEVVFSLFSDASSSKTLNKVMQTKRIGDSGEAQTKVYKDYSKHQQEAFKNIQISNLAPLYQAKVKMANTENLEAQVIIYGVSSGSVKALRDIHKHSLALGIEVNTSQELYRGQVEGMTEVYQQSKDNPAVRNAGRQQGRKAVADEVMKNRQARRRRPAAVRRGGRPVQNSSRSRVRTGSTMVIDDEDDE